MCCYDKIVHLKCLDILYDIAGPASQRWSLDRIVLADPRPIEHLLADKVELDHISILDQVMTNKNLTTYHIIQQYINSGVETPYEEL